VSESPCCPEARTATTTLCANASTCPGLETRDLAVRYHDHLAVQGVALEAPSCAITALVGPSGCGKSTVLACLNRLIDLVPDASVSGQVLLGGRDIRAREWPVAALRKQVGMIFQRPTPFPLSIRRNLALPLREHGVTAKDAIAAESERCLRAVGLWDEVKDRLDKPATSLSGGQQQRLCLARTLVLRPQVLLLDEPCSSLDPISAGVVEDLIVSLRGRYTVVVVTHDLAQAHRIADRLAVFWNHGDGGRIVAQGTAAQVFSDPGDAVAMAYLAGRRT
jgi:phosphate transport system ATP-binding protein